MKNIPQYRASFPNNYNRIIHYIKKNYAKTQDIGQTKWKDAFDFKNKKKICNLLKSTFLNTLKVKHLSIYLYTALGDLHIYTKHILGHDQYYYISERPAKNK